MDRPILSLIVALWASVASAQYYTFTNEQGAVWSTPSQADALAFAVGAVTTSDVPYAPEVVAEPDPHPSGIVTPIIYMPSTPIATNGFAVAVQPDGSVDTEHWYGSPTNTEAEIKAALAVKYQARQTNRSASVTFDTFLGTNTYKNLRNFYRTTINLATTNGSTTAQNRNAFDAVLKLDRLNRLRERRDLELLANKKPPKNEGE